MNHHTPFNNSRTHLAATLVALLTIVPALLAAPPAIADEDGSPLSPVVIAGSNGRPYELAAGGEELTTYIGFNKLAFTEDLEPRIKITTARNDGSGQHVLIDETVNPHVVTPQCGYGEGSKVSVTMGLSDEDIGLYSLTFKSDGTVNTEAAMVYDFRISVTCTVRTGEGSSAQTLVKTQDFLYRAYIAVVDSPSRSVSFSSSSESATSTFLVCSAYLGEDMEPVYAYADGDRLHHDFYAVGLPDGLNMKLDGEISGKPAGYMSTGTYHVDVYAVSDQSGFSYRNDYYGYPVTGSDPRAINRSTLDIEIEIPADAFEYIIGDENPVPYADVGFVAIKDDDALDVSILNIGTEGEFKAYLTYGGELKEVEISEGNLTVGEGDTSFAGMSGIVRLTITETVGTRVYTASIHIMIVGPVVHSGLAPTVTSSD